MRKKKKEEGDKRYREIMEKSGYKFDEDSDDSDSDQDLPDIKI